ncbi:MAG: type II toxin-antitoxin system ParD family antitoxin [Prevotella sp.]|nr:type II toxin-antitoxin system ParD family antitoxin [Prevotella sp.]
MKTIEVHLDEHWDEFIQKMIGTGEYTDASDVISDGLYYLETEDSLKDAPLKLTPKACLEIALTDTGISDVDIFVDDINNRKFCSAFTILERRMKSEGYITDENGDTHHTNDASKPADIFARSIRGFYPNASNDQLNAAWELFVYHMERQGNTKSNETEVTSHNENHR